MEIFEKENVGTTYSLIKINFGARYWKAVVECEGIRNAVMVDPLGINILGSCLLS